MNINISIRWMLEHKMLSSVLSLKISMQNFQVHKTNVKYITYHVWKIQGSAKK